MIDLTSGAVLLEKNADTPVPPASMSKLMTLEVVFNAPETGRLAPGAKADLVLVDLEHPAMKPLRDPLRSLIFTAAERAVRHVYVGGEQVVRDGRVLTLDHEGALGRLEEARERAEARVPELDWDGRTGEELSPLSLPVADSHKSARFGP